MAIVNSVAMNIRVQILLQDNGCVSFEYIYTKKQDYWMGKQLLRLHRLSLKNFIVQLPSHVWLFVILWTSACQASLSITISQSLLKLMSVQSVMPSNNLLLRCPLLLLPSIFPSIRVFSNESVLPIRWPKCWSFQLQHQAFQWIFRTDFL